MPPRPLGEIEQPALKTDVALWSHQQLLTAQAVMGIEEHGYHYWYSDCGTGKTLAAIAVMLELWHKQDASMFLVLTVKAAMNSVWREDIENLTEGVQVHVLDKGTTKTKNKRLHAIAEGHAHECNHWLPEDRPIHVVVVNYETARRLDLQDIPFDGAIADESHRLSSHNSKQSLILAETCSRIPAKLAMTGTAWADHLKQVFGQFRWLNPIVYSNKNKHAGCELFGHWNDFLDNHCMYRERDNIKIIYGYKNIDGLMAAVAPHITRIKREEVIDLPPIHHIKRRFDLTPMLKTHYKEMEKEKATRINDEVALAQFDMTQRHRLHQLSRGWFVSYPDNIITRMQGKQANTAIETTVDLLDELNGEPTVIFTSYKEDVDMLAEAIQKRYKGTPIAFLTGGKDSHSRFVHGSSNILIANLQAGSTGVRLHRAKYIIFYGLSPSTARTDYLQAIERVHRHGQENTVHCYHIIARGTVDEDAYKLLTKKEKSEQHAEELL